MFFGMGHVGRQGIAAKVGGAIVSASPTLDLDFTTGTLDPRITFTRASTATYFDSSGTIQTAGYNQVRNSTMAGAVVGTPGTAPTNWVIVGVAGVTISIVATGVESGIPYIDLSFVGTPSATGGIQINTEGTTAIAAVNGQTWTGSFYCSVLAGSVANIVSIQSLITMRQAGGSALADLSPLTFTPVAGPIQRYAVTSTTNNASCAFVLPKSLILNVTNGQPVNVTLRLGGPQLELASAAGSFAPTNGAANGAPRFDYDPVTHALRGLLIEEARTNMEANSASLATWSPLQTTLTGAAGIAPDGTNSMRKLAEDASNNFHTAIFQYTIVGATTYSFSVFAKAAENRFLVMGLDNGAAAAMYADFDLVAGTFLSQAVGGAVISSVSMQPVGNGIWRCSLTGATNSNTIGRAALTLAKVNNAGGFPSYQGVAGNGVLVWGVQFEAGAFPTSYIPTTAAAVTRSADLCSIPTSPWYNFNLVSLMFEIYNPVQPTGALGGFGDNATFGNSLYLVTGTQFNRGGISTASSGPLIVGAVNKICGTLTSATIRCCTNAGSIGSAANTDAVAGAVTLLAFGGASWNLDGSMNGHIRRARYWPRVLSDAEMQSVTT